jgi:hypothetical protein
MMQAPVDIISARAVDFDVELPDLSSTQYRRIWLSQREPIWMLVSAVDYPWLSENMWNVWHAGSNRGDSWMLYAKRNVGPRRSTVRAHREIMIAADPGLDDAFLATHVVDHINGQTLDNRARTCAGRPSATTRSAGARAARRRRLEAIVRRDHGRGARRRAHQLEEIPF